MEQTKKENKVDIKDIFKRARFKIGPAGIIALSFLGVILIGSILLSMPFCYKDYSSFNYLDALFTSTSCCCVTGLFSYSSALCDTFTTAGIVIMICLVQLGGLGVTSFALMIFIISSKHLTFNEASLVRETWNINGFKSIKKMFLYVILVHLCFEVFGTMCGFFIFFFRDGFNWSKALGYAAFNAISSFNNSGFDLFGKTSLINYSNDYLLLILNSFLIIMGGIGYFVIVDVLSKKFRFKRLSLNSKIAIIYTFFLLLIGTLLIYLSELGNDSNVNIFGAFFISTSTRTAGFTCYDFSKFRDSTLLIMMLLMFIGGCPSGTAGGLKITTMAVFFAYLRGFMLDKSPHLFKRTIKNNSIKKAFFVMILGIIVFILGAFLITCFEGQYSFINLDTGEKFKTYAEAIQSSGNIVTYSFLDYAFEAISAFATCGFSKGFITPYYEMGTKIILIFMMYIGRIGPISLPTLFISNKQEKYRFVSEDVTIG